MGIEVSDDHFYTSAISTAKFLQTQKPVRARMVPR
jgi:hypothetical protein